MMSKPGILLFAASLMASTGAFAQGQPPPEPPPPEPPPPEQPPPEQPPPEQPPEEVEKEAIAPAAPEVEGEGPAAPVETAPASAGAGVSTSTANAAAKDDGKDGGPEKTEPTTRDRWLPDGRFMDTRVSFVFTDDNLLADPEDRSRQPGFVSVHDEQFYENLEREKRGRETETQLVLYKRMPSYFRRLDAEAALVLELENWVDQDTGETETHLEDDGSYIKLNIYTVRDDFEGDNVSLTLFPTNSQRFLLGYTYDITWGGARIFPNGDGFVPGARLMYDFNVGETHEGYVFAGLKTASLLNAELGEQQMYYGVLGGGGVDLTEWLDWDVNGGYFQRGSFPNLGCLGVEEGGEDDDCVQSPLSGEPMDAFGFSTRLVFHHGLPIADSVDFRLYKITPDAPLALTEAQEYDDGLAWSVGAEFTNVWQELVKIEDANSSELVPSKAAAVSLKTRFRKARLHGDFIFRDLSYVVFDIPGVFPYYGYPDGADVTPEWFVTAGLDYFFETPRLTPGVVFAYKQPACYTVEGADGLEHTLVFRSAQDLEILPAGEGAFDILSVKATLKWDIAPAFAVLSEIRYTLDKNQSKIDDDDRRVYHDGNVTNQLGFSVLAQARW